MTRGEIAKCANEAASLSRKRGAPHLTANSRRDYLIAWLVWNDPNGAYTDEDAEREDFDPLTVDDAWDLIEEQVADECK